MRARKNAVAYKVSKVDRNDVTLDRSLGYGSFGQVFLGKWNNAIYAIKYFDAELKATNQSFYDELKALEFLSERNAPNVVRLYGKTVCEMNEVVLFHYLILDYIAGGDLNDYIEKKNSFPRVTRYNIIIDITEALCFIHLLEHLHKDIKPSNILLTKDGHAKLCDFGLFSSCEKAKNDLTKQGSEYYCAPELMTNHAAYNTKGTDMYSWALTFWSMFDMSHPFDNMSVPEITTKKLTGLPVEASPMINVEVGKFFKSCWQVDDKARPSADNAVKLLVKIRDKTCSK